MARGVAVTLDHRERRGLPARRSSTPVMILERPGLVERTGVTETSDEIIGLDKETGHLRGESSLECANHFTT